MDKHEVFYPSGLNLQITKPINSSKFPVGTLLYSTKRRAWGKVIKLPNPSTMGFREHTVVTVPDKDVPTEIRLKAALLHRGL